MNGFTIRDIENLSGIKAHTIRMWEARYDFLKPQRTDTNIRYYTNEDLKAILNISLLNRHGYKISHISKMSPVQISAELHKIQSKDSQQEHVVNTLIGHMVDLNLDSFEDLLGSEIETRGLESAIDEIVFPFLERIGILWLTNHINPAQEHLVTNLLRQKFLLAIERLPRSATGKTALLFLPEGEHHELGLIYVHYLLRQAGVGVLYLGADVPLNDLQYVVDIKKPQIIYTHLTSSTATVSPEVLFRHLSKFTPGSLVLVSGAIAAGYQATLDSSVQVKTTLGQVKDFVHSLSSL